MSAPNQESLQRALYEYRNPRRRWLHRQRHDRVLDALARHAPAPCRLAVEVGIGSGVYLPTLAEYEDTSLGIDFDAELLAAVYAGRCLLAGGDVRRLPLADDTVDLLLLS